MKETIYDFTAPSASEAEELLVADPDSAKGTLFDAVLFALGFNCSVTLTDKTGVTRGYVRPDGSYSLN